MKEKKDNLIRYTLTGFFMGDKYPKKQIFHERLRKDIDIWVNLMIRNNYEEIKLVDNVSKKELEINNK